MVEELPSGQSIFRTLMGVIAAKLVAEEIGIEFPRLEKKKED